MEKPESIEQFKSMVKSMRHRERACFDYSDQTNEMHTVEIYATDVDGFHGLETNINVSIVNILGKREGESNSLSKYLRLWNDQWFGKVYNDLIA